MSSRREMWTSSVSNVIYHKFSHGAAFYTLNGKNVNVMLELQFVMSLKNWWIMYTLSAMLLYMYQWQYRFVTAALFIFPVFFFYIY